MISGFISRTKWHRHVNAINPPPALRFWLSTRSSLTAQLRTYSQHFSVQCLNQCRELCLRDEYKEVGLSRRSVTPVREVLLYCDNDPVVFAHTLVTATSMMKNWPLFKSLGNASLGSSLFADPLVKRGKLQFIRLRASHPLTQRIHTSLPDENFGNVPFYARRCLFQRKRGAMLITEVFLPKILNLQQRQVS